ncbi:olfactory receptor 1496-like [Hemibagrus wyckioides]|uniref:olfactory receptor 1496-like n=1 Tax=Hemibagrus wyckioides TaxID=337641 RepID=UPI00266DC160|nr:olfactory receptor 1496-like [Hemibagrus wyckioides]
MVNSTHFTTIILTGYFEVGQANYIYFALSIVLYITIILANSLLIGVICVESSLHEPMYILLGCLLFNELYGSAAFFPFILTNLLNTSHEITIASCYVQIFLLYTYASVEFGSLAVMSYDRYMAICYPLVYSSIMTSNRVCILIVLVWLITILKFSINICLSLRLDLCGNVIEKVWCDNYLLVKLACSDTSVNNIYGIFGSIVTIVLPFLLIVYSYMKILRVCLDSSVETTQKAMSTCIPQLVSLLNFALGCSFEIFSSRFDKVHMPSVLRVIISVYFVICPPLLNPIMYGIRLSKIKSAVKKHFMYFQQPLKLMQN